MEVEKWEEGDFLLLIYGDVHSSPIFSHLIGHIAINAANGIMEIKQSAQLLKITYFK